MQEKTSMVAENSARLVPNIHKGKTKVLKINAAAMLESEALEEVENFTYLGSIVDTQGGTDAGVRMQEKTSMIADNSGLLVLNIHKGKTKVLKINAAAMLEGEALEEVENFTYLGNIVDTQGGTDADVEVRTGKASYALFPLEMRVFLASEMH
nr:hypothetical protein BaRGS_015602 [Batillaria attramentaria]KAG5690403.1 hypothetical protein BaRGS_002360 [Batillaria attramentaria]